jgi:hypothetical protein
MSKEKPEKKVRGAGRVAFIAMMDTIKTELEQGHTARSIYTRYQNKFEGVLGYWQYCQYMQVLRSQRAGPAIRVPSRRHTTKNADPEPAPATRQSEPVRGRVVPPRTEPSTSQGVIPRRPFTYDGNPRADDKERLIWGTKPLFPEDSES